MLLLDTSERPDLVQIVQTLLILHTQVSELQHQLSPDSGERLSFVYQLLSSRNAQSDVLRRKAGQLQYILKQPRVAILFSLAPYNKAESVALSFNIL